MLKAPLSTPTTLGADLRALRKARGITLEEMAEGLERSLGWMSQVERDISQPGIDDLRAIAKFLDVPLSLFFGQADGPVRERGIIVRANARRKIGTGPAGLVEELLSPDLTDDFEVVHSTFEPGSALKAPQTRPTQEVGYLVSGRLTIWVGEQKFNLNPGDSFRIRGEPHRWANPHSEPAVAIWVIAPPVY